MPDPDHQELSADSENRVAEAQQRENGRVGSTAEKTAMTPASPTFTDSSIDFSTDGDARFLTARELRDLEDDPVLTERDVWGGSPEPPSYDCSSCGRATHDPTRTCPDCALEERGGRR